MAANSRHRRPRHGKTARRRARPARRTSRPSGFLLTLYITGATPNSAVAIANITRICRKYLAGRHRLEIVDLYRHPERAAEGDVIAAPTLVKRHPLPVRRFIGNMSNEARVLEGLGTFYAGPRGKHRD